MTDASRSETRDASYTRSAIKQNFADSTVPVFITYRNQPPVDRVAQAIANPTVQRARDYSRLNTMTLRVAAPSAASFVDSLARLPWVAEASIASGLSWVQGRSLDSSPGTGPVSALMAQTMPWGVDTIDANLVHSLYDITGSGVTIAFIDAGIQCYHYDLEDNLVGGYNATNDGGACADIVKHGTGMAGIAVAVDDASGVVGVAPGAGFYSVKVCNDWGGCTFDDILDGFEWAVDEEVDIISMSIGTCVPMDSVPTALKNAITGATASGIVVVAAGGNGEYQPGCASFSPPSRYAQLSGVIGVSALTTSMTYMTGHQFGADIDLAAPAWVLSDSANDALGVATHSSAAVPHVSGVVALLLEAGNSPQNVFTRLTVDARDMGAPGKDNYYGYGMVDALAAVVPAPQITGMTLCSQNGILYGGTCQMQAQRSWGLAPFEWSWQVKYGSGNPIPISPQWDGTSSFSFDVPPGSYGIEVTVRVREDSLYALRHRYSLQKTYYYVVCPSEDMLMASVTEPTVLARPNKIFEARSGSLGGSLGGVLLSLNEETLAECPT